MSALRAVRLSLRHEPGDTCAMSNPAHWEEVYSRKRPDEVSWFAPHLRQSLSFIEKAGLARGAAMIDVGGGASTLVDDLLERGHSNVTVLDISANAIEVAKRRLGPAGAGVQWLVGDITKLDLPEHAFEFWHDRAVFHFLREPKDREKYVANVRRALKPGGHIVVATFGPDGPLRCSGLDVMRFSSDQLHREFGGDFHKVESLTEIHATPSGGQQQFVYCYCRIG